MEPAPAIDHVPPPPRAASEVGASTVFGWHGVRRVERRLGVVLLVIGLVIGVPNAPGLVGELLLVGAEDTTSGTIVDVTSLGRNRRGTRYQVEVEYEARGRRHLVTGYVTRGRHEAAPRDGDAIDLTVADGHPTIARPTAGEHAWLGLPTVTFLVMAFVGAALWARAAHRRARAERAFREGIPIAGQIVERRPQPLVGRGARSGLALRYTYELGGETWEGELSHHDPAVLARAFPGDDVVVLVDPTAPRWSALWVG